MPPKFISITGVRIDEIRLRNLRLLVEQFGSTEELERLCKVSSAYLDQLLDGATVKSGKPRKMGDSVARRLEKGCEKGDDWIDTPQWQQEPQPEDRIVLAPDEQILLGKYRRASAKVRRVVQMVLDLEKD